MKVIIKGRRQGKTTDCIRLSISTGATLVVTSEAERERVLKQAKAMNLTLPPPVTFTDLLGVGGRLIGKRTSGLIIDNIDMLIEHLARGVPVRAISMTKEEATHE